MKQEVKTPQVDVDRTRTLAPLSFSQEQLWLVDQMQGDSTQYSLPDAQRIRGSLNIDALVGAMKDVIRRHEILRTIIVEASGSPLLKVIDVDPSIPFVDLSSMDEEGRSAAVDDALRREWQTPFALQADVPFRICILRLSADDHILLRTFHHIAFDGWSLEIFDRELENFYGLRIASKEPQYERPTAQYSDFARWDRSREDKETWQRDIVYWRRILHNAPYELELPRDYERSKPTKYLGAGCLRVIQAEQFLRLKEFCREFRVTPFVALLSVYSSLLTRYSSQSSVVVGYPSTDRLQPRFREVIGHFARSMFARIVVDDQSRFKDILLQVNSAILDGDLHRSAPFAVLADQILSHRESTVTPFCQSTFAYQPRSRRNLDLPGVQVIPLETSFGVRYEVELYCWRHGDSLELHWLYNRALFEPWRIESMANHFLTLLNAMLSGPDRIAHKVPLHEELSEHQISRQVHGFEQDVSADDQDEGQHAKGSIYKNAELGPIATLENDMERLTLGIGRLHPMPGFRLHVLDANMQLTVRGIVGKIYVSATDSPQNAARNGDENRTLDDAAADVAALWKATCTGDIGRYDREGRVELIAKDGDYVWFRGMLVNLSRIEHYLKKTGSITEVGVALSTDSSGRPELVAYIFSPEGRVTELTVVRTSLGQSLPTYMIPSRYVSVVRLPRKGNGEVDRSKLKELDQDCSSEIEGYTAPQTYLQETVCTMFSELLDVQPVGVHDNFFELGGHSLILTRLANRIKTSFGIRLPIHNLLEKNSPFQLCEMIEQHLNAPAIDSTFIETETKPRLKRRS